MQHLHDIQVAAGANIIDGIAVSFGNELDALLAAREGVALCDRSHWGRILVSDDDRLRFLHNQSTNDFQSLKPGAGCDTVFVSSTARTIDLVTAYVLEDAVLLLVSPNRREYLLQWLDKYIFFADKVKLKDITNDTATFSLIGLESQRIVKELGAEEIINQTYSNHQLFKLENIEFRVAIGSGLAIPGYTLIVAAEYAAKLWKKLVELGAVPLGEKGWEQLRITQGRPIPDQELTDDYNPLEAGLWQTISFTKGCYIGQETIARLNTYKGVKQQLWGIRLAAPVEVGSAIALDDEKVGKLTSFTETEQGYFGLGYVRTKAGGEGLKVRVGEVEGEVVEVPFLTREAQ
ncbi:folate-binding protein YgfZ [Phormidium sp. LEGE 05292]|uniref:CAF17-like 4Fe-4S cluster assembly/insertion protein YgfZ n=1 Tax=[Phormidium] sp. LEGE 05292 TaxID=767427 RepID=UPI001882E79E|nr:folate-binding protein YgfZ [Phormidium sp. LEGE 05292]MBE9224658.1 folate-binding protein YgfZ [Phormidium sp. LEGE 05292]